MTECRESLGTDSLLLGTDGIECPGAEGFVDRKHQRETKETEAEVTPLSRPRLLSFREFRALERNKFSFPYHFVSIP